MNSVSLVPRNHSYCQQGLYIFNMANHFCLLCNITTRSTVENYAVSLTCMVVKIFISQENYLTVSDFQILTI